LILQNIVDRTVGALVSDVMYIYHAVSYKHRSAVLIKDTLS